jgi:hypothetical protein
MSQPTMSMMWWLLQQFVVAVMMTICATMAFDLVHLLLHRFMRSSTSLLRRIGSMHGWHHAFLDEQLNTHANVSRQNFVYHLVPSDHFLLVL